MPTPTNPRTRAPASHRYWRGRVPPPNLEFLRAISSERHGPMLRALRAPAPERWDSREKGWVGPVKDQQQCGSCWCFSGVCVVEVAFAKAGVTAQGEPLALSEEYVLDCGRNGGCSGDDNTSVLQMAKADGLVTTAAYGPYTAGSGSVGRCHYSKGMTLYPLSGWGFADGDTGTGVCPTDKIKQAIMAFGAVGCAVAADSSWDDYTGGVYTGDTTDPWDIDHDVVLVGWDDAIGAWLMRNSWGTRWGDQGHMWIKYGANLIGTEAVWAQAAAPTQYADGGQVPAQIAAGQRTGPGYGVPQLILGATLSAGTYSICPHPFDPRNPGVMFTTLSSNDTMPAGPYQQVAPTIPPPKRDTPTDWTLIDWQTASLDGFAMLLQAYPKLAAALKQAAASTDWTKVDWSRATLSGLDWCRRLFPLK